MIIFFSLTNHAQSLGYHFFLQCKFFFFFFSLWLCFFYSHHIKLSFLQTFGGLRMHKKVQWEMWIFFPFWWYGAAFWASLGLIMEGHGGKIYFLLQLCTISLVGWIYYYFFFPFLVSLFIFCACDHWVGDFSFFVLLPIWLKLDSDSPILCI